MVPKNLEIKVIEYTAHEIREREYINLDKAILDYVDIIHGTLLVNNKVIETK
jgi:hypothetical protein